MPDDTAALRAIVERLSFIVERKQRPKRSARGPLASITIRFDTDEILAIDQAAAAQGISRSDLIREALQPVLRRALRTRRIIPDNFLRKHNRRKPAAEMFKPTDSDARLALAHNLALRSARIDSGTMTELPARGMSKLRPR